MDAEGDGPTVELAARGTVSLPAALSSLRTADAETRRETAESLAELVEDRPAVATAVGDHLEESITSDGPADRETGRVALDVLLRHGSATLSTEASRFRTWLRHEDELVRIHGARAIVHLAEEGSVDLPNVRSDVPPLLESDLLRARWFGLELARLIVEEDPASGAPLVPALVTVASAETEDPSRELGAPDAPSTLSPDIGDAMEPARTDDRERAERVHALRREAGWVLVTAAEGSPEVVEELVDALIEILEGVTAPDVAHPLVETLGRVAVSHPGSVAPAVTVLSDLLDAGPDVGGAAVWTLGVVAEDAPSTVGASITPALPVVVDQLSAGETRTRVGAATLLGYVAEVQPDAADEVREPLRARLDEDEDDVVRASAALALGYVAGEVEDALAEAAESDPSPQVRSAAARALEVLAGREGRDE